MPKPRIFISSTHYDLKHVRSSLEIFIDSLGYESVLSEKGNIAYNPNIPLDESCYIEAQNSDIFVIIIGGRYGSEVSHGFKNEKEKTGFYERYESITKMEYESAVKKDVPIYILIDRAVMSEYQTYRKNRDNVSIKYAHVDSINIFIFIEIILSQNRNNPVKEFEKHTEIQHWLKSQWALLFQSMIKESATEKEIMELKTQVTELSNLNMALKAYLENLVKLNSNEDGSKLIEEQEKLLNEKNTLAKIERTPIYKAIRQENKGVSVEETAELFSNANTLEELAIATVKKMGRKQGYGDLVKFWRGSSKRAINEINEVRELLNKLPLE